MIKGIFFDYGGLLFDYIFNRDTLFKAHELALKKIREYEPELNIKRLNMAHEKAIKRYLKNREKSLEEWPMEKIMRLFLTNLGLESENGLVQTIEGIYKLNDHDAYPREGIANLIKRLSNSFSLHIISNLPHNSPIKELSDYNLLENFATITFSYEAGYRKPHPSIYRLALTKISHKPEETIFISHDSMEVKGAERVGMSAQIAESVKQIEEVLSK